MVRRSNAVLYVIHGREDLPMLPKDRPHSLRWRRSQARARVEQSQRADLLQELADFGGGRFIMAGGEEDLQKVFLEVLAEVKTRYLITYYPSDEVARKGWHDIKVNLTKQKGEIRARRGYFYPAGPGPSPRR